MNTRTDANGRNLLERLMRRPSTLLVVLVFGLLLWARFLLVTGHPRTAIAEPEPATPPQAKAISHADDPDMPRR